MKGTSSLTDPFVWTAFLVLGVSVYTFVNCYIERDFLTFLTEDEITHAIEQEFPLFVDYL